MALVSLSGLEEEEVHGTYEEEDWVDVPGGLEVGVCKGVSTWNESRFVSGLYLPKLIRLSTSSRVYSTLIHQILVEEDGMTSMSLVVS